MLGLEREGGEGKERVVGGEAWGAAYRVPLHRRTKRWSGEREREKVNKTCRGTLREGRGRQLFLQGLSPPECLLLLPRESSKIYRVALWRGEELTPFNSCLPQPPRSGVLDPLSFLPLRLRLPSCLRQKKGEGSSSKPKTVRILRDEPARCEMRDGEFGCKEEGEGTVRGA